MPDVLGMFRGPGRWSDRDFERDAAGNLRAECGTVIWRHGLMTVDADVWCNVTGAGLACYAPIFDLRRAATERGEVMFTNGPSVPTARGVTLEWDDFCAIRTARWVDLMTHGGAAHEIRQGVEASRLTSGEHAELAVMLAVQAGLLPIYCQADRHSDRATQLRGIDMTIAPSPALRTWEIKFDRPGGPAPEGTGRLFFQTHTRNPPAGSADRWQEKS